MAEVLRGYRILDFGRYISGPFCAALLADLGADVIRVEPLEGSDDRYVMPVGSVSGGALHQQVNRGKRSLTLAMGVPGAREVLESLVKSADVVIVNMPPSALAKLGLDYATLSVIRPDIVLTSINAYGPCGPFADTVGFDGTGQALSGAMSLTGTPDQPFRSAVSYVDYSTAISAALGTVAALLRRERTGKGEHVQCSLLGSALTMANPMLIEEAAGARSRVAMGNRSPIAGPSDLFRTRDGWIMIQVIGQAMFRRWADVVAAPELINDPRFADDQARGENGVELSAITAAWAANRSNDECLAVLREHRLPVTAVLTPKQVLRAPEVEEGGFLRHVEGPGSVGIPIVVPPFLFAQATMPIIAPAPMLGEHTDEILYEEGFDAESIARLRASGALASTCLPREQYDH